MNTQSRNNAILGLSLVGFCTATFTYTVYQMKNVNTLGPEFDEKLGETKSKSAN